MCIASILVLNNLYKVLDAMLEYLEHVAASALMFVTISLFFMPLWLLASPRNAEEKRPLLAIAVLVSGVVGGLLIVIGFVFLCKNCFKKKQPLSSGTNPSLKRYGCGSDGRKNYEVIDGSSLAMPVPKDYTAYLQQPQLVDNNNSSQAPDFAAVVDRGQHPYSSGRQMTADLTQQHLVSGNGFLHSIVPPPRTPPLAGADCWVQQPAGPRRQRSPPAAAETPGMAEAKNQLSAPSVERQRAQSTSEELGAASGGGGYGSLLAVAPPAEPRRRSWDDRLRPGTGRRLPRATTETDYYASRYDECDGQWRDLEAGLGPEAPPAAASTDYRRRQLQRQYASLQTRGADVWPERANSPQHGAISHLPRSHQIVIERTSPPPQPRKQHSSPTPYALDSPKRIYSRSHRNSASWDTPQRLLDPAADFPSRHRANYSFDDVADEPSRLIARAQLDGAYSAGGVSDAAAPSSSGGLLEFDSLHHFYRQVQAVFGAQPNYEPSTASSSSGSNTRVATVAPVLLASPRLSPRRQSKSLEIEETLGGRLRLPAGGRLARSFDEECMACRNDSSYRRGEPLLRMASSSGAVTEAVVLATPVQPVDEQVGWFQIKQECKELWSLRNAIADDDDDADDAEEETDAVSGGGTPYTTSFESNTEAPPHLDDYLRRHRPSGPFLEPPKLSLEAKRQKYKNLFARRQCELQRMAPGSFENSFESFGTSSWESNQDMMPTSFESNQSAHSGVGYHTDSTGESQGRKKISELKGDSGYKSQSTDAQHVQAAAASAPSALSRAAFAGLDKMTQMPSVEADAPVAFFVQSSNGDGTDGSRSGESCDEAPTASAAYPPLPPNVHLARMSRSYQAAPLHSFYRYPMARDYGVDSKTDAVFRDFVKFEPQLEVGSRRRRTRSPRAVDARPPMSPQDSIEEESAEANGGRQRHPSIPIIRFPDEQEVSG